MIVSRASGLRALDPPLAPGNIEPGDADQPIPNLIGPGPRQRRARQPGERRRKMMMNSVERLKPAAGKPIRGLTFAKRRFANSSGRSGLLEPDRAARGRIH
jgi:hypothetical protein